VDYLSFTFFFFKDLEQLFLCFVVFGIIIPSLLVYCLLSLFLNEIHFCITLRCASESGSEANEAFVSLSSTAHLITWDDELACHADKCVLKCVLSPRLLNNVTSGCVTLVSVKRFNLLKVVERHSVGVA